MNRNKKMITITATAVAGVLILHTGSAALAEIQSVSGVPKDTEKTEAENTKTETDNKKAETEQTRTAEAGKTGRKEETVYAIADASGAVREVIVSSWLKNLEGLNFLNDSSVLRDIENTTGNETFSQNGDSLVWNADGNNIYYEGKTDKELPVSVHITYYLDGQEIKPEDLSGKTGKVMIRYDFTNHEKKTVTIKGKDETISVPFTVMSGMVFSNGCVKNVEINSGKVITEDDRTIVIGMAFPGLKESLQQEDDSDIDLDIPDYVEITMDAEDFEMDMAASVVFSDALNDLNLDSDGKLDDLRDDLDELSDAADELVDGTNDLADGVGELYDKVPELKDGVQELKDGITDYTDGVATVNDGVASLKNGSSQLADGTASLASGAGELASGAKTLTDGASALKSGAKELKKGSTSASEGVSQLLDGYSGDSGAVAGAGTLAEGAAGLDAGMDTLAKGAETLSSSSGALTEGLEELSKGLEQLLLSLEGDKEQQITGQLEELHAVLQQFEAVIGSDAEGANSIRNSYDAICKDAAFLYRFYTGGGISESEVQETYSADSRELFSGADSRELFSGADSRELFFDSDSWSIEELKNSADSAKREARESADRALESREKAANAVSGAQDSTASARDSRSSAEEQSGFADTTYESAMGAYTPLLSDIRNTLQTVGMTKYAGYVDDGQNTASTIAGSYQSASAGYESSADSYEAAATEYENAVNSYEDAGDTYGAAIESYEQTIADYEAIIQQYELMLSDGRTGTEDGNKQTDLPEAEETFTGSLSAAAYGAGTDEETAAMVSAAWEDLFYNLKVLDVIQNGDSETSTVGLNDSLAALEALLFGAEDDETDQGSLGEMTAALHQMYGGVGALQTTDTNTLLGGSRALQAGSMQLSQGADSAKAGSSQLAAGAAQLSAGVERLYSGTGELGEGLKQLEEGAGALYDGAESLSKGTKDLSKGAGTLSSGTRALVSGANELDSGVSELQSGVSELDSNSAKLTDGADELSDGSDELTDGVEELKDGSEELRDGMEEFNEDGIQKLVDYFNDDIEKLIDRLEAVQDAGMAYQTFAGMSEEMDGNVKFIIKTDAITKE